METQNLEFKRANNQMSEEELCKYCVAIANEGGGQLVLGVTDERPRKVVGTKTFVNPIKTTERLYQILNFRVDIEEFNHPSGRVVIFHIPERARGSAYNYKGQYLMRNGSQLTPMSEDQLRIIFSENKPSWLEEYCDEKLSAQEFIDCIDTQAFFDLFKQPYPTSRDSVIKRFEQERLIKKNSKQYSIKRLCALLFAKSLYDFPELERKMARVIIYSGISKLDTISDSLETKGYAVGFRDLVGYIMSHLPQNEEVRDSFRHEITLVPDIVVRELVANALIHQDFSIHGVSVMVEIYTDRIEISNPGEPVVPPSRFIDEYRSRNERLAEIMRRIGICEEKGSGIDKVVATIEAYQLPAPDFITSGINRTSVILFGYKPFDEMSKDERIRACYQHACLKWVMHDTMTNQTLRERFNLPERKAANISQLIALAIETKMIKVDDSTGESKKYAKYIPIWA